MRQVLLLNATYEPLTTLPLRRAVCLVLREKAEIVHQDISGACLRSATMVVEMPSVIRLLRYVRIPYRQRVPLTRAALMRRDNFRCVYCGRRAETIDHVIPRSRGGKHLWENCVASCMPCNHEKADKLLDELGWQLPVAPAVPAGRPLAPHRPGQRRRPAMGAVRHRTRGLTYGPSRGPSCTAGRRQGLISDAKRRILDACHAMTTAAVPADRRSS